MPTVKKETEKKRSVADRLRSKEMKASFITLFAAAFLYAAAFVFLNVVYADRIFPGVKVAGVSLGGKLPKEASYLLKQKTEGMVQKGVTVSDGENTFILSAEDVALSFDNEKTSAEAVSINKMNYNLLDLLGQKLPLSYQIDEEKLEAKIAENLKKINTPATESKIIIEKEALSFTDEKDGEGVDADKTKDIVLSALSEGGTDVAVSREILKPKVTKEILEKNRDKVEAFLSEKLTLTAEKKSFEIKKETLAEWIVPKNKKGEISIKFDEERIAEYLKTLEPKINITPVNAKLKIENGKAVSFALSVDGKKLDIASSVEKIASEVEDSKKIELEVQTAKAEVNEGNMENLGIKELVASGYSDFKGSPKNRIHNVTVGAAKFNGVLIKPGEEFSFNKNLGPVDASTGFLEELVILQDKTVPQFGGGLCQVSSTAFRAALNSGLPITARKAHAYPVQYYKPYGVDATIYLPNPDLRFKNDTGAHILIQTKIERTKLTFEFYGTKKKETYSFAGNPEGTGGTDIVEKVASSISNQELKGRGAFDAVFYRLTYDSAGSMIKRDKFFSSYDSPDKYPH